MGGLWWGGGLYNRGTTVLSDLIRLVASGGEGGLYNRDTTVLSGLIRWVASGGEGGLYNRATTVLSNGTIFTT